MLYNIWICFEKLFFCLYHCPSCCTARYELYRPSQRHADKKDTRCNSHVHMPCTVRVQISCLALWECKSFQLATCIVSHHCLPGASPSGPGLLCQNSGLPRPQPGTANWQFDKSYKTRHLQHDFPCDDSGTLIVHKQEPRSPIAESNQNTQHWELGLLSLLELNMIRSLFQLQGIHVTFCLALSRCCTVRVRYVHWFPNSSLLSMPRNFQPEMRRKRWNLRSQAVDERCILDVCHSHSG